MSPKTTVMTDELHEYLVAHGSPPDEIAAELIEETRKALPDLAQMQISPEQGAFMTMLTKLLAPRFVVEVGTFTGYSALAVARGLRAGARLLCCDVSEKFVSVGRPFWERAGVADRIDVRIGPAIETLRALPQEPLIDMSFVDADKPGYLDYWDELVPRTRSGGVLLIDNVLMGGRVVDPEASDDNTAGIRRFNEHASADQRVELVMLPISDGITMARKL